MKKRQPSHFWSPFGEPWYCTCSFDILVWARLVAVPGSTVAASAVVLPRSARLLRETPAAIGPGEFGMPQVLDRSGPGPRGDRVIEEAATAR